MSGSSYVARAHRRDHRAERGDGRRREFVAENAQREERRERAHERGGQRERRLLLGRARGRGRFPRVRRAADAHPAEGQVQGLALVDRGKAGRGEPHVLADRPEKFLLNK